MRAEFGIITANLLPLVASGSKKYSFLTSIILPLSFFVSFLIIALQKRRENGKDRHEVEETHPQDLASSNLSTWKTWKICLRKGEEENTDREGPCNLAEKKHHRNQIEARLIHMKSKSATKMINHWNSTEGSCKIISYVLVSSNQGYILFCKIHFDQRNSWTWHRGGQPRLRWSFLWP